MMRFAVSRWPSSSRVEFSMRDAASNMLDANIPVA